MFNINKYPLTVFIIVLLNIFPAYSLNPPDEDCEKTPGEAGILATSLAIYTKVRNCVKTLYNECLYFESIHSSYKKMKNWFKKQADYANIIKKNAVDIIRGRDNVFEKLKKLENIFDIIDHVALSETKIFDKIICNVEESIDSSFLLPNTKNVCNAIDHIMPTKFLQKNTDNTNDNSPEKYKKDIKFINDSLNLQRYPNYQMVEACKTIISSSIANSNMYLNWAQKASLHYRAIDSVRVKLKNVNEKALFDAWLRLEQANAYNKKILHSNEELKVLTAILSEQIYEISQMRGVQLQNEENFKFYYSVITEN